MPIHTVLGPIEPGDLGPTSMHEHVLSDLRVWSKPPTEPVPAGVPIGPELLGYLRWNALSVPDNLVLGDIDVAVEELRAVHAAGGDAVVELTLPGMGRRIEELPDISRRSGVRICVGCGWYVEETMPQSILDADVDVIAQGLIDDLTNGIEGTGIKPALIGEIGTSFPVTDAEWRVLRASAIAAVETGSSIYIHLSFRGRAGLEVLDFLVQQGVSPDRVIVGHLDENFDADYHTEVARRGAVLAYDTFGSDFYYGDPSFRNPTDAERFGMVQWLIGQGFASQLVIAADVWTQSNLKRNGGYGYDHLFRRVIPGIGRLADGDSELIRTITIENPRRLLNRP